MGVGGLGEMARKEFVAVKVERGVYEELAALSAETMVPMARLVGAGVKMVKERYGKR